MKTKTILLIFAVLLVSSLVSGEQSVKTIELPMGYVAQASANTDYIDTINIQSPDGIDEIISLEIIVKGDFQAITNVKGKIRGSNNSLFNCVPVSWVTPNVNAPDYEVIFDCTNLVKQFNFKSGSADFGIRVDKIAQNIKGRIKMTYYNSPKTRMNFFGTEYQIGDAGTTFIQLLDDDKQAINDATCYIMSYYPNKSIWWNNELLTYHISSDGIYYKDFTASEITGLYILSSTCYIPSISFSDDFIDFSKIENYENVSIIDDKIVLSSEFTTNYKNPTNYSDDYSEWANPNYAIGSDDDRATTSVNNRKQDWYDFNFDIPATATIDGIILKIEGSSSTTDSTGVDIELSWNGGSNYTNTGYQYTTTLTTDAIRTFGNTTNLWGRNWTSAELNNENFRIRLNKKGTAGVNHRIDNIRMSVNYTLNSSEGYIQSENINLTGNLWNNFSAEYDLNDGSITFEIRDVNNNTLCTGLGDISSCANSISPIKLYAKLTDNAELDSWEVDWLTNKTIREVKGAGEIHISEASSSTDASDIWNYAERNLTYYQVTSVNETSIAQAVWNWNGDINLDLLDKIVEAIWNYVGRYIHGTII